MDDNPNPSPPPPETPPGVSDVPSTSEVEAIPAKPEEEFPLRLDCPQCRRPYRVESLNTRVNTLLTETQLLCPRCRRKLRQMRLKYWYDHYVQGQKPDPVDDDQNFAPKMLSMPNTPPSPRLNAGGGRPKPNEGQRRGGGRRNRNRRRHRR